MQCTPLKAGVRWTHSAADYYGEVLIVKVCHHDWSLGSSAHDAVHEVTGSEAAVGSEATIGLEAGIGSAAFFCEEPLAAAMGSEALTAILFSDEPTEAADGSEVLTSIFFCDEPTWPCGLASSILMARIALTRLFGEASPACGLQCPGRARRGRGGSLGTCPGPRE